MRFVCRMLATVALLALWAAPASAKPGHGDEAEPLAVVTIYGPGLDDPIQMSGDRAWRVLYLSAFRGVGLAGAEPPSAERLGPAFEAVYRILTNGNLRTLRQTLYPCSDDGRTWTFTPSGQDRVHQRMGSLVQSGWWHSVALARVIGAADLTVACRDAAVSAGALSASPSSWAGVWTGLGAVVLLAMAGALARGSQRRRQPVRA